jgi:adenine-specific DNA methylase
MPSSKLLIEVALPIKEISAESVRDKSIRHGHISTLHLWWARRPLPVCRAVVFASLVPDPLDPDCPPAFLDAVEAIVGKGALIPMDPYRPYDDIPYTAAIDPMEDNLRNRLLMFIGKFSTTYVANGKAGRVTPAKDLIAQGSLIKFEARNKDEVIERARKLIFVAHNAKLGMACAELLADYDRLREAIRAAERELYDLPDRHLDSPASRGREAALASAIAAFQERMPLVFDPFAGGGAIPLEAARLGCRSHGNDLNPVAHIVQLGSLYFPQKFGKPALYSRDAFIARYGKEEYDAQAGAGNTQGAHVRVPNRLSFDVDYYGRRLLASAKKEIGHLYPADDKGKTPVAYYWARTATCANPSCEAEVPLLRDFYLVNKPGKQVWLKPIILPAGKGREKPAVSFEIAQGKHDISGWLERGNLRCPACGNITEIALIKKQFFEKRTGERILAVIEESPDGKAYRLPTAAEIEVLATVGAAERPTEPMPQNDSQNVKIPLWGFAGWGDMFSRRQLLAMQTFVAALAGLEAELGASESEYGKAVLTYLGIFVDRIATRLTSFGLWNQQGENVEHPFGRQAIPMVFDYPEPNPFCGSSGGASNQLEWIIRYIDAEAPLPFFGTCKNYASGDREQFPAKSLDAVVTDPPYYDAIAYADLSDFFYIWLKRTLGRAWPLNFATPQTPKDEECTALKHHHDGKIALAKAHFETTLLGIFKAIEHQCAGLVSVMFAHQSTEAWTTLCNSILKANMNITGSWAIDTERTGGVKVDKAFLESSVTVSCRPQERSGIGEYKAIRKAIEKTVREEVRSLYSLGFRGADLLTACFGQAVAEFGRFESVEKADGSAVSVAELLALAREAAFIAIVSDIAADDLTRFYLGWLNLFGFTEADHDDAARITQVGLSIDQKELRSRNILIARKTKEVLADFHARAAADAKLGERADSPVVDLAQRAMLLFEGGNRSALLGFLARKGATAESPLWRVLTALAEVLPAGCDDQKQVAGLLANRESLLREVQKVLPTSVTQQELGM